MMSLHKNDRCVIVVGNLSEGFYIVGPFETFDDAAEYASENIMDIDSWIMSLKSPEGKDCG